jgi:hypothetical protein
MEFGQERRGRSATAGHRVGKSIMLRIGTIAAALAIGFAFAPAAPAHAVPVVYTLAGSGTGTSISGSFTVDSAAIASLTMPGDHVAIAAFTIVDSILGVTWSETDTVSTAELGVVGDPSVKHVDFLVEDTTSGYFFSWDVAIRNTPTDYFIVSSTDPVANGTATWPAVPAPEPLGLLGLGLLALGVLRRRLRA